MYVYPSSPTFRIKLSGRDVIYHFKIYNIRMIVRMQRISTVLHTRTLSRGELGAPHQFAFI